MAEVGEEAEPPRTLDISYLVVAGAEKSDKYIYVKVRERYKAVHNW